MRLKKKEYKEALESQQLVLRNCFRTEFQELVVDQAAEFQNKVQGREGLQAFEGVAFFSLEACSRFNNLLQFVQEAVDTQDFQFAPEDVQDVFGEKIDKPLQALKDYPWPEVQEQLSVNLQDMLKAFLKKTDIEVKMVETAASASSNKSSP